MIGAIVGPRNNIRLPDGMETCQSEDADKAQCLVSWQVKTMNKKLLNNQELAPKNVSASYRFEPIYLGLSKQENV